MLHQTSTLGTALATVIAPVEEKGWFRRRMMPREFEYLEWVIDGVPLRRVVAWPDGDEADEVTPVHNDYSGPEYEADYLRALLGQPVTRESALMSDGRAPLLLCPIDFDLNCGALTAEIVQSETRVEWRDIAWQRDYEPLDVDKQGQSVISLSFDRLLYQDIIQDLLESALARRISDPAALSMPPRIL